MERKCLFGSGLLVGLALLAVGCKPKEPPKPEPMGSAAPAFDGKQALAEWVAGKWCVGAGVSSETAQAYGVEESDSVDSDNYWLFAADGTFYYYLKPLDAQVKGTWKPLNDGIMLDYKQFNEEPLEAARQRFKDEASGGGSAAIMREQVMDDSISLLLKRYYLVLGEDKKTMEFSDPGGAEAQEGQMFSLNLAGGTLVRMK